MVISATYIYPLGSFRDNKVYYVVSNKQTWSKYSYPHI
jgi:hypothetical protein